MEAFIWNIHLLKPLLSVRLLYNFRKLVIFLNHIDFCCGGNKPLIDAIHERNLSATEVLTELNTLYHNTKRLNELEKCFLS